MIVWESDPLKGDGELTRDEFRHGASEPANDAVLLDSNQGPGLSSCLENERRVQGLHTPYLQDARDDTPLR